MPPITLAQSEEAFYQVCCQAQVTQEALQALSVLHFKRKLQLESFTRDSNSKNPHESISFNEDLEKTIPAKLSNIHANGLDAEAVLRHALVRVGLTGNVPSSVMNYHFRSSSRESQDKFIVAQVAGIVPHYPDERRPECMCFALDVFLTEDFAPLGPFSNNLNKKNHLILPCGKVNNEPIQRDEFQSWVTQVRRGLLQGVAMRHDMQQVANRLSETFSSLGIPVGGKWDTGMGKMKILDEKKKEKENGGAPLALPRNTSVDPYSPLSLTSSMMVKKQRNGVQCIPSGLGGSPTQPSFSVEDVADEVDWSNTERSEPTLPRQVQWRRGNNTTNPTSAEKLSFLICDAGDTDSNDDSTTISSSPSSPSPFSSGSLNTIPSMADDSANPAAMAMVESPPPAIYRRPVGQSGAGTSLLPSQSALASREACPRHAVGNNGPTTPHAPRDEGMNHLSGKTSSENKRVQHIRVQKEKIVKMLKRRITSEILRDELLAFKNRGQKENFVGNGQRFDANGGENVTLSAHHTGQSGTVSRTGETARRSVDFGLRGNGFYLPRSTENITDVPLLKELWTVLGTYLNTLITREEKKEECAVCFENPRNVVCFPCKHFVMCKECASHEKQCPICRETVTGFSCVDEES